MKLLLYILFWVLVIVAIGCAGCSSSRHTTTATTVATADAIHTSATTGTVAIADTTRVISTEITADSAVDTGHLTVERDSAGRAVAISWRRTRHTVAAGLTRSTAVEAGSSTVGTVAAERTTVAAQSESRDVTTDTALDLDRPVRWVVSLIVLAIFCIGMRVLFRE